MIEEMGVETPTNYTAILMIKTLFILFYFFFFPPRFANQTSPVDEGHLACSEYESRVKSKAERGPRVPETIFKFEPEKCTGTLLGRSLGDGVALEMPRGCPQAPHSPFHYYTKICPANSNKSPLDDVQTPIYNWYILGYNNNNRQSNMFPTGMAVGFWGKAH